MRIPDRNRCGPALAACCVALIISILFAPCTALSAEYRVLSNGSAYNASVEVAGSDRFEFYDFGVLGERIPIKAGNITISGNCSPCQFNQSGTSAITYTKGNYTLNYTAPLRDFHLQAMFDKPYNVNVTLPEGFDVRNPLLAGISQGGTIVTGEDNSTTVMWSKTTSVDLRFYDKTREDLLYLFGNFWLIIAVVLLVPFLFIRRTKE